MRPKRVTTTLDEIEPGTRPCLGTASATSPNIACPRPARWHGVLHYERPGTTMTPGLAEWWACDVHTYPIAQHMHCQFAAQEGMADLIADAERRFAMAGPLR